MARLRALLDRRWTVVLSIAAGATVLLIAVGVYTMAARAAETNEQAAALYLADETIRTIEIADARARQLVMLTLLSRDGFETTSARQDSRTEFDTAVDDARSGIVALVTVGMLDEAALTSLDDAEQGMVGVSSELASAEDLTALTSMRRDVLEPLAATADAVAADRDELLDRIDATSDSLRAVATLVGFVVAFVVPTVAVVVHRVATRPGRLESELRADLGSVEDRLSDVTRGAEDLMLHRVVEPLADAVEGRTTTTLHPGLREADRGAQRVLLLLRLGNGTLDVVPAAMPLAPMLERVSTRHDVPLRVRDLPGQILTDPTLLEWCLDELVANACAHGSAAELEVAIAEDGVALSVIDHGVGLPPEVAGLVFGRRSADRQRRARRGEFATGLLLVASVAERLGGRLEHERRDGMTRLTIRGAALVDHSRRSGARERRRTVPS